MKLSSSLTILMSAALLGAGCAAAPIGDNGGEIDTGAGGTIGGGGGLVAGSGGKTGGGGIATGGGGNVTGAGGLVTGGGGMTGSCTTIATLPSSDTQVNLGTTGAYCFRTDYNISGWSCWNMEGRTITLNGQTFTSCAALTVPAKVGGYYTFQITAGSNSGAGLNWWGTPGGGGSGSGGKIGGGGSGGGSGGKSGSGGKTGSGGSGAGGKTGSGGSGAGGNGVGGMTGGNPGWASRYWDCCKPACGWTGNVKTGSPMKSCSSSNQTLSGYGNVNACDSGGDAYMCWNGGPWQASATLAYGFAATKAVQCGRCFQLQFTGTSHNGSSSSCASLAGKTMIIQVVNNGGVADDQFDLLIPGGGVGQLNACTKQWGSSVDLGATYGGFLAACNGSATCVKDMCGKAFAGKPDLAAGCDWFLGWFGGADNPNLNFKQVACPSALTQRSGLSDPG